MIKIPVVGIPSWKWKKRLLKQAIAQPLIEKIPITDLCYELDRHAELLKAFDKKTDIKKTAYFKYQRENDNKIKTVIKRIGEFRQLYKKIRSRGIVGYAAVITEDGCRLDGSHRLSILKHLNVESAYINVVYYDRFYDKEKIEKIKQQVKEFRRTEYGFED